MLRLWGDKAPQDVDPRPHGLDLDDESDGGGNGGIEEAGRRRTRIIRQRKKEGGHGVDEDEIRRLHHNICIELRPERTLAVTWLGASWMSCYMFEGIQPRLEFYVDAGKLFSQFNPRLEPSLAAIEGLLTVSKEIPGPLSVRPLVGLQE